MFAVPISRGIAEEAAAVRDVSRIGLSVHDFYASVSQYWLRGFQKAAWNNTHEEGVIPAKKNVKEYHFTASRIICPDYCDVICREFTPAEEYAPETERCRGAGKPDEMCFRGRKGVPAYIVV